MDRKEAKKLAHQYIISAIDQIKEYKTYHQPIGKSIKETDYDKIMYEIDKIKSRWKI